MRLHTHYSRRRFLPIIVVVLGLLVLLSSSIVYAAPAAATGLDEACPSPSSTEELAGLGLTPGALGLTPGALGFTPGALGFTPGALGLTPGALGLTPGALGLTPGALGLTPGALGLTPGALGLTPGALGLTPGALGLTPGALALTPGALSDPDQAQAFIDAVNAEIAQYTVDTGWFLDKFAAVSAGYEFNSVMTAILVVDDFDNDADNLTHGEIVLGIVQQQLAASPIPLQIQAVPVDITDENGNFVILGEGGLVSKIRDAVQGLEGVGVEHFILNLSFGLIPCNDTVTVIQDDQLVDVNINIPELYPQYKENYSQTLVDVALECVAYNGDDQYTAHFQYSNPNAFPVTIPQNSSDDVRERNKIVDYSSESEEIVLQDRTPFFFGFGDMETDDGELVPVYPNTPIQIVFDGSYLTWDFLDQEISFSSESTPCASLPEPGPEYIYGDNVELYDPGLKYNGGALDTNRTDPTRALGAPQNNDTINFVSLGFGGELILSFNGYAYRNPFGTDLKIYETSYGGVKFSQYPEAADVYVADAEELPSSESEAWVKLTPEPSLYADLSFELPSQISKFKFVRIVDTTGIEVPWTQGGGGDGYDVDAIKACGEACNAKISTFVECVSYDAETRTGIAHFGYENKFDYGVIVPAGNMNKFTGPGVGGATPPTTFGLPNVFDGRPGRTDSYPNNLVHVNFVVPEGSTNANIVWTLKSPTGKTGTATASLSSPPCQEYQDTNDYTYLDFLIDLGVQNPGKEIKEFYDEIAGLGDDALAPLADLLQTYLNRSADPGDEFQAMAFAAAGNSRVLLETKIVNVVFHELECPTGTSEGCIYPAIDGAVSVGSPVPTDGTCSNLPENTYCAWPVPSGYNVGDMVQVGVFTPEDLVLPFQPASLPQTVAVSALMGETVYFDSTGAPMVTPFRNNSDNTTSPGYLGSFSHDGNAAAPGAYYRFSDDFYAVGTSFASPLASTVAALYLTYDNACEFDYDNSFPTDGLGNVPLIDAPTDYFNTPFVRNPETNVLAFNPLNCQVPLPPKTSPVTCNGLDADIWVLDGMIYGGEYGASGSVYNGSIHGTSGPDVIVGSDGPDNIRGFNGDDVICGLEGDDIIRGGEGNDIIFGGSMDMGTDPSGEDRIYGEEGNDSIYGGDDNDRLYGNEGDDLIRGAAGDDVIDGGTGNDQLVGQNGEDVIRGGVGNDTLWGEAMADRLDGGTGCDVLNGQGGDDILIGGPGDDQIYGGLYGQGDFDKQNVDTGNDVIRGGPGNDYIVGGDGDDNIRGNGTGYPEYNNAGCDNNDPRETSEYGTLSDSFSDMDYIYGGDGNDVIQGNEDNDFLYGGTTQDAISPTSPDDVTARHSHDEGPSNNDVIRGGPGNDYIEGGVGNDTLRGDDDNDTIIAGPGNDNVQGNDGNDVLYASVNPSDPNFNTIDVDANNVMRGGDGNDTVYGSAGKDNINTDNGYGDMIYAYGDDDIIRERDGLSFLSAGDGKDNINIPFDFVPSSESTWLYAGCDYDTVRLAFNVEGTVIINVSGADPVDTCADEDYGAKGGGGPSGDVLRLSNNVDEDASNIIFFETIR